MGVAGRGERLAGRLGHDEIPACTGEFDRIELDEDVLAAIVLHPGKVLAIAHRARQKIGRNSLAENIVRGSEARRRAHQAIGPECIGIAGFQEAGL